MSPRLITVFGAIAIAVLALGGGFAARALIDSRTPTAVGTALGEPFELITHAGDPITEAAFQGRPSLLFFGFTHCPEICPTTVYDMETWLTDLNVPQDAIGAYFVTVDPERDTAPYLADYLTPQSDRIVGITGEPEKVWDMAKSWRVYWQKRPLGEGDYTVDHYASIFVLNTEGAVVDVIPFNTPAEEAKAKIQQVL
ncbi:MAG: SCO family protein [Pseudomonadota bacterium]